MADCGCGGGSGSMNGGGTAGPAAYNRLNTVSHAWDSATTKRERTVYKNAQNESDTKLNHTISISPSLIRR